MVKMVQLPDKEAWKGNRKRYLGGSDVACVLGLNPYKTNVDLFNEKTGNKESKDISNSPVVKYGTDAEPLIREIFKLDHPELTVTYIENNSYTNDRWPFAAASLDGLITDSKGRQGVLEIKTSTIHSIVDKEKWMNKIPQNYFCQVLYYMAVCELEFVDLVALLKNYSMDSDEVIKSYHIERSEVEDDIRHLMQEAAKFWDHVEKGIAPALKINL